jgi:hypothetical protein
VLVEEGDRIQSPKRCVLKKDRMMDNIQNCDSYVLYEVKYGSVVLFCSQHLMYSVIFHALVIRLYILILMLFVQFNLKTLDMKL